jgi:hypothetical protein
MKKMYLNLLNKSKVLLVLSIILLSFISSATTCPSAVLIPGSTSFPSAAITLVCGTTNDITGAGGASGTACGSTLYMGGNEALYVYTPSANISGFTVSYTGVSWTGITIFQGCPTTGGTCLTSVTGSGTSKITTGISLTAGTTYYIMIDTWPTPASPCPGSIILNGTVLTPCSGTPNAGLAAITSSLGCPGNAITLSATGLSSGGGINLQWQRAPALVGPWVNIVGGTTAAFATSTTTTTYYRLVTTCTTSALSATSSVVSYSVNNLGPCVCGTYPLIYASSSADEEITNVTIGSMNNSSTCTSLAGGLGSLVNLYSNYAGIVTGPTVAQASSVSFSLTQTTCGGAYNNFFQIYVDWNQDGDWLDAGEQVYSQAVDVNGNQTVTGSFAVPITSALGTTRIRVVNIENIASTTNYAHTAYTWGETEDYCITIVAGVNCSGTPNGGLAAISSSVGCPGNAINLSSAGLTIASGLSFQWQSATSATGPWANITGAVGTSYATATTTTTFYRIVTTCSLSALSGTSSVVSYSVNNPGPCICGTYGASNATITNDEEIFNVTLGSLNNSSTCSSLAPGLGSTLNKYSNYAGFVAAPSLMQTASYPLAVTVGQCGTFAFSGNVTVYIDYNQNGLFTDAGEMVYLSPYTSFAVAGTLLSTSIVIPPTALLGTTRMRVIAVEGGSTASLPTGTYFYGETEDYCVNIAAATPCSGTPNTGTITISNTAGCSGGIINFGSTGLSTGSGLTYQWQSATAVSGPWVNIAGASTTSYSTTTVAGSTYYQLVTTCTTSALSNTSNAVSFNGISCGTTLVPASGSNTITCGASTKLYDDGGASGNYATNDNGFTVINNGGSGIITISGTYLNIESCCDYVKIYSGAGIGGTLLYTYAGSGTMTTFSSTPGQILTVQFYSDPSVEGEGFDMNVIYTGASSPSVSISASSPTVCSGSPITLTASGADSYVWSTSATTSSVTVTPAGVTVYSVTGTTCASTNTAVYTVTISPSPSITVNSGAVCPGGSFTINPLGGTSYTFSSGSAVVTPTAATTYTIWSASSTGGCLGYALSSVSISGYPVISVYSGTTCSGSPFNIIPSGAVSYTYSGGSAVVSPTVNTTYTITGANLAGCTSTAVCNVSVVPGTPISASANPTLICVGEFATLSTTSSATSFTWNTGATTPTISVSPTGNTVYSVSSLDVNGCLNFGNVTVLVNPCTGIEELTASYISVYPNPHTGIVNLVLPSELAQRAVLEMYDAIGKLMLIQDLTQELNTINMMDLPNGLYTYKVINQSQVVKVGKLVKQ